MKSTFLSATGLAALCILMSALTATAQQTVSKTDVPRTISYQGALTSNNGAPLPDGDYNITVSLYTSSNGGDKIWTDTYATHLSGGIFNLYLGAGNRPLPDPVTMSTPLWIGTAVDGTPEMYPLTPLSASPYALNISNGAITTGKLADGAVTADKVKMNYISGVEINDQKVAGVGTVLKLKSSDDIRLNYDEATNSVTIASNKDAQSGTTGDPEKGASTLDAVFGGTNWLGRDPGFGGGSYPSFDISFPGAFNTLAGGSLNTIGANSEYSTITGGSENSIAASADYNFIGGGELNAIDGFWSAIVGGDNQTVNAAGSTIAGGSGNIITGNNSTIAGGGRVNTPNTINGNYSFIGAGNGNTIEYSDENAIGAGNYNTIHENVDDAMIGAGVDNEIYGHSYYNFIGAGQENVIHPDVEASIIGSGRGNDIQDLSNYSFIGSGTDNVIDGTTHDVIGGGDQNSINTNYSVVGGGQYNAITQLFPGAHGVIGGGEQNIVSGDHSTLGGGAFNVLYGDNNSMIGGYGNQIISNQSTIGGGQQNNISKDFATIGGGESNSAQANFSTIPGGDHLRTTSYAQTAVGFYNAPRGSLASNPPIIVRNRLDDPLFMVGNGIAPNPFPTLSNAFEVSYNGHSVVFDVNGTSQLAVPASRAPFRGATYVDNVIYAWGDIDGTGAINADFGVASVVNVAPGVYTVTIRVNDPTTGLPIVLTNAAITATLVNGGLTAPCGYLICSRIGTPGPNQFQVRTNGPYCDALNLPFMFHVTGRP